MYSRHASKLLRNFIPKTIIMAITASYVIYFLRNPSVCCAFVKLDDVSRKILGVRKKRCQVNENNRERAIRPGRHFLANSRGVECHLTANNPTKTPKTHSQKPEKMLRDTPVVVVAASKFGRMTVIWVTAFEMFLSFMNFSL